MRQSSVVKALLDKEREEIVRKERAQAIIKNIEFRIGPLDEELKSRIRNRVFLKNPVSI